MAPLFAARPIAWQLPESVAAIVMTSATAARLGGPGLARLTALPLYAVGEATARAAAAAGFTDIRTGQDDAVALGRLIDADGIGHALHLAGQDHRPIPTMARIETRIVYVVDAVPALPAVALGALAKDAVALLHSPRAAALFAMLVETAHIRIAAISAATAQAAGPGWAAVGIAIQPTDDALLAVAARLCEEGRA